MIYNLLIVAIRNLRRDKLYTMINVFGLGVGMACFYVIILFAIGELGYDRFHKNASRIYRVVSEIENKATGETYRMATTPYRLTDLLRSHFPEIEEVIRFYRVNPLVRYGNKQFFEDSFCFVDTKVFDVFSFSLALGDPKTALTEPYSIVISKEVAQRYFGNENPIGNMLWVGDSMPAVKVVGVLNDLPSNSHLEFQALLSINVSDDLFSKATLNTWRNTQYTYVLLRKGITLTSLKEKISIFVNQLQEANAPISELIFQPIVDIHLYSNLREEWRQNSSIFFLYAIGCIGVLLLFIACLNFVNLVTARSTTRSKEIGLRQVVGAHRQHLIGQFLGESILLSCIALCMALVFVYLTIPWFNILMQNKIPLFIWGGWGDILFFIFGAIFIGVVAGCYPALHLSKLRLGQIMKGAEGSYNGGLRNVLVIVQFCISIVMLITTGVVFKQLSFIQSKELGFDHKNIIVIKRARFVNEHLNAFRAKALEDSNILLIGAGRSVPSEDLSRRQYDVIPDGGKPTEMTILMIDSSYFEALGISLEIGRNFSADRLADLDRAVIINRTAMEEFGWNAPLGKTISLPYFERQGQVIGVVEDFHFESLHREIVPIVFVVTPRWYSKLVVRVRHENMKNTLEYLERVWAIFAPDSPFDFYFLSEKLDVLYQVERRHGYILSIMTGLSVFVASLGLFGLITFTTERRIKEICIRKILGASMGKIVVLLVRDFLVLILIASLIAWPIAFWVTKQWITNFAYRIDLGWAEFVLGTVFGFLVAILTVGYQAGQAARANPVDVFARE